MSKKNNSEIRSTGGFSDRPRRKLQPVEPEQPVEETPVEASQEEVSVEPVEEAVEETAEEPVVPILPPVTPTTTSDGAPQVVYDEIKEPLGSKKDSGILLTILLSTSLILVLLGFLFYYEHSWRLQEQQENTLVETGYEELSFMIKGYIKTIHEPNKAKYCKQISEVYTKAAKSSEDIDKLENMIKLENRKILSFDADDPVIEKEYEWQRLLGASGIINTWLANSGITVTQDNHREIYMAIARGFE